MNPPSPTMPDRPESPSPPRGSCLGAMMVAMLLLVVVVVLFVVTMGYFVLAMIVGGLVIALGVFHYCVWGWWLSRIIEEEVREEDL